LDDHRWHKHQAVGDALQVQLQLGFLVRAYLLQAHEMLFDAHNHAFHVLGGGIYDSMHIAVDKVRGKERNVSTRSLTMVSLPCH